MAYTKGYPQSTLLFSIYRLYEGEGVEGYLSKNKSSRFFRKSHFPVLSKNV